MTSLTVRTFVLLFVDNLIVTEPRPTNVLAGSVQIDEAFYTEVERRLFDAQVAGIIAAVDDHLRYLDHRVGADGAVS